MKCGPLQRQGSCNCEEGKEETCRRRAIQSGNIYISIQGVYLFAILARLLRHQSPNQTALHLSRASVVSLRAGFGVSHNFTLRPKWWWIIHPGLFHLRVTKVLGVGGWGGLWWSGESGWGGWVGRGSFVRSRQTHFRPLTASRRFIWQHRCRACRCRYVHNQSSRTMRLFH